MSEAFSLFPYKGKILSLKTLKSGRLVYKNKIFDLIAKKYIAENFDQWFQKLEVPYSTSTSSPRVIHFFYELSFHLQGWDDYLNDDDLLAIDLIYADFQIESLSIQANKIDLSPLLIPQFADYERKFQQGRKELILGNCYQFNLTEKFISTFDNFLRPMDFINQLWAKPHQRGAFAQATYIQKLDTLFLSNSPECLFQIKKNTLHSMPIKGTHPCAFDVGQSERQAIYKQLVQDPKNEAELFMIADLLLNDMAKIEFPRSWVIQKKAPLFVPGLVHQYAHLAVKLGPTVTIKKIIECLFPGGSVTGAPKKRVLQILHELENSKRGFYCGSTLLLFQDNCSCSINIRSSEIDFEKREMSYSAGGGITLKSDSRAEFDELMAKASSFFSLLKTQ